MPRRSSKRHSPTRRESGKFVAAIFLAIVTAGLAGGGIYVWATAPAPLQRDKITLCPSSPPKDIIVAVLDTTDGLPGPAKTEALSILTDIVDSSPENALFELRVVDPKVPAGRIVLTLCNPGDGSGLSYLNAQPERAKQIWRSRFREPLVKALEGNLYAPSSQSSPLLATFQGIALDRFTGAKAADAHKQMIIVSDMIEHIPGGYTQYPPAELSYERFRSSPSYRQLRTDLHGTSVDILYIDRGLRGFRMKEHIEFWLRWINDNNGQVGRDPIKLQGAGKS